MVAAIVYLGISVGLFRFFVAETCASAAEPHGLLPTISLPPAPHIEDHPATELQQLRQEGGPGSVELRLEVDKKNGAVRIPIDRAIELQLQRGFPVRKEVPKR